MWPYSQAYPHGLLKKTKVTYVVSANYFISGVIHITSKVWRSVIKLSGHRQLAQQEFCPKQLFFATVKSFNGKVLKSLISKLD